MRTAALLLALASFTGLAQAEPRVDNVLAKMVPPGTTSLVGARMDLLKATDFYKKMVAAQKLPQVDRFAEDSGFDPRRDVRELLFAQTPKGSVLLARGTFRLRDASLLKDTAKTRHGEYQIWGNGTGGFCILDSTLAVAGEIPAIEAALDEWKSGSHTAALPLLAKLKSVSEASQIWGVSNGAASFLADNLPTTNGIDFSKIFRGLEDTWFEADVRTGLKAIAHGTTAREQDAASLKDAIRGLVGLGRLNVPANQPELLKLWDGISAEQTGRTIIIRTDIPQELLDKLIEILGSGQSRPRSLV